MARTIGVDEWLSVLDREYLSSFVEAGGGSIKFALADEDTRTELLTAVRERCERLDYLHVSLKATDLRVHMPQDIFSHVASKLDWRCLARRMVLGLAEESGFQIEGIDPAVAANVFQTIGDQNALPSRSVVQDLRPAVEERVSKNRQMLRDFRVAMRYLCLNEVSPDHALLKWLTGSRVGLVREFSVYTRIDRTTARHFIESTATWVRLAGYCGTVLSIDNSRVAVKRNPRDGLKYYTSAMATDHFELLREFIDGINRMAGTMIIVTPNEDFMEPSRGSETRNVDIYPALQARVMEDVRDKRLVNPMASLVRLRGNAVTGNEALQSV